MYSDAEEYRITGKLVSNASSTLESLAYTYDNIGNITKIANTGVVSPYTKSFLYDTIDRLVAATTTTPIATSRESYTYSLSGNILSKNGVEYSYENDVFPHAVTSYNGNTYTYDNNGNLSTKNTGSDTHTYLYDWNNRLLEVKQNNSTIATYRYTDTRERLSKQTGTSTTYFLSNLTEYTGTYTNYIFSGQSRVLTTDTTGLHYNHQDHLQSSTLTTNTLGTMEESVLYTPYGNEVHRNGTHLSDYTYTDQYKDSETGLLYYDARYYDSEVGRFTSVDPQVNYNPKLAVETGPQTLNTYTYANNNPIRYNDPTGNWFETGFDVAMVTLSFKTFAEHPTLGNGIALAVDALATVAPGVPAGGG
jgi:RHS repeat-associated protein